MAPTAPTAPSSTGYFWVGQDGNVYSQNSDGSATNQGTYLGSNANGYDAQYASGLGTQIADPSAPASTLTANAGASTGAAAAPKVFNQAGADNTQLTINQLPALLQAALAAESTSHANTVGGLDASQKVQQGQYDAGTVTNQKNYDSNFMDSIRAGIHGLGGLMSLLRGSGAGGGTAEALARDAVGTTADSDIAGGAATQKENQGQLDGSLSTFLTDLKQKRQAADDTFANNQSAIKRDSNTQLQDLFGKMAGFYGDVGNTAASNDWMNRAGALTPDIAANSKTQVTPYDTSPIIVHAPNLTAFAPPTQPSVTTAPDGQVGAGLFTMNSPVKRKDATATPTATPAPVGV